jgi:transcriptional regulator of heat shock response
MAEGLTARQTQILKSLVDEYIETAEPVGSEALEKKYSLGISPATVRNEMATLTSLGYLRQPHTSAGRVPTPTAMKFYIDQLMEEKQMSVTDEVKTKEEVWDVRDDPNALMREAVHALAQRTRSLAIAALDEGRVWHSGYANVFLQPEFDDLELSASIFSLLEEVRRMHELFFERMTGETPVEVIFGEELGWSGLNLLCVAGTRFEVGGRRGALGVVGPARLSYSTVIPVLRYFRNLIQEIASA